MAIVGDEELVVVTYSGNGKNKIEVGDWKSDTGNTTSRGWFGRRITGERDQGEDVVVGLGEDNGWCRAFQANGGELCREVWGASKRGDRNTWCSFYNAKAVLESMGNTTAKMGQFRVCNEGRRGNGEIERN